ncbi:putative ankyrin repeat protein RF_0381 [Aethina tumida]|uniref:putative ankyrin repeat protein RF_0381 n=1 Tax=Aethina tumida TaxID=116153 RepID=UPI002147FB4E|nr:putative ankyrin repeat protein RF_0381 [Aethina tumida]
MDEDDENGKTPLMTAIQEARNDSTDLIKYLIEAGADVHKKSKLGRNVWHWLALNDNLNNEAIKNVAKTLEPKIIDVEEEDGYTPLLIALREVRTESTDFIKYLIENKANIHKKNKEGQNIWHCLACNNKLNNVGIENVTKILTSSLNEIDEEDENGVTPLMIAIENARNDSIDLIQYLKEHGANMGKRSNLGRNIWHFLAFNNLNKEGIENVTKLLLTENGIDEEDFEGSTPLLLAIQLIKNDSVFLIKYLIECGVNIYKTNNLSQNIWHYLCFNNNLNKEAIEEVVEILSSSFNGDKIENIDDQDENGVTPLMVAVEKASNDSVSLIKYLIKQGANIYKRTSLGQNIWYCLSFNNNLNKEAIEEVLKILKSSFNGDNIGNIDEQDENGATPLMVAVQRANNDSVILVKYLVEHKANIYKRTILGRNIWHYLGFNNQLKNEGVNSFVKMLLHYFGDNKRNGINEEDEEGSTPLRIAVQHATNDSVNLIKCLLECGANVHMKNKHGQNVWHWLGFNKNLEGIENVANILMSCSSDNEPNGIDEEDEKGFTPLMIALQEARNNTINLIKYLVEHGASIHKKNKLGRNVWHLLGFNKDLNNEGIENIANILMSCSSDNEPNGIDEEDEKGFTPLMIALQEARNNSTNLIKYLVEHGASIHKKNKLGRDVWHCLGFNRNLNNEVKKDIAILIFSLGVNQD